MAMNTPLDTAIAEIRADIEHAGSLGVADPIATVRNTLLKLEREALENPGTTFGGPEHYGHLLLALALYSATNPT